MDLSVQEVIDGLFSKEALEAPSDTVKPDELELELPEWYDEKKFKKAQRFYWENCFALTTTMLQGLLAVLAVPSILHVLVGSRRSSSPYTSYKRYLSTILHTTTWFEYDLKPDTRSWKSLYTVRSRHLRAGLSSKLRGGGVVSQRDIALTQFGMCVHPLELCEVAKRCTYKQKKPVKWELDSLIEGYSVQMSRFMGFALLKPDKFGIRQLEEGEWDAYNHFWRTICHMIGLQDRYNLCRKTVDETREVCQAVLERVYTPCLENVPEYFEHMARVLLESMWCLNPTINVNAMLYFCRSLADVPGYIYTEAERRDLQDKIKKQLKGKPLDTGVESTSLIAKSVVEGLPARPPRLLYLRDYDTVDSAPNYKNLEFWAKYSLNFAGLVAHLHTTYLGRLYFKWNYLYSLLLMKYFPYLAFFKFGIRASMVNIFQEDPTDETKPKPNSEYNKPKEPEPWYRIVLGAFW